MGDMLNANTLHYPFTHSTNPHAEQMEKIIHSWVATHFDFLPEKVKKKYVHTGMGHCGGCIFPKASMQQLQAICRFFIWAFTVDDTYEFSTPGQVEIIEDISLQALRHGRFVSNDPLYATLPVMRRELLAISSPEWLDRFCESIELYFQGLKEETRYRVPMIFPDMETFIAVRTKAVNVLPMVNLAEAITGTVLPGHVIRHPYLERLAYLTCRILSWSNDYFSAHLEKGHDVLNLVLMLEHHNQSSLSEAYVEMLKIHDRDVAEFVRIGASLPDFREYNRAVKEYVNNLELMIAGYLHWTLQLTERYKKGGHPSLDLQAGKTV
ncbi:terpene synthase family protein [Chitinophaga sp. 22620]|uniref:terpene synthase family protein n=1 Tax=Chitinophaga sp. 22620 TaxID=3453952 RepID=UPI003F828E03